jgi:hypothetical protein
MNFSRHAFISYAHDDNEVLSPAERGWVAHFHDALAYYLRGYVGNDVDIWRDEQRVSGNMTFAAEILRQFPVTATLIPVFSPSYLKSEWCDREINSFYDAAKDNGGVMVGTLSRIFKVVKIPIEHDAGLPDIVSQTIGYLFYNVDKDSVPHTLDPSVDKERPDFLLKVEKLAWDIKRLLAQFAGTVPEENRPYIYLAECSSDRRADREAIERELENRGYTILPDRRLPENEEDCRAEVGRMLALCRLSIHLVGSGYGVVPDGPSGKSVVVLQNEIAVEASRRGSLARVISVPAGTKSDRTSQQEFIDALHKDRDKQFAADLTVGGIEELKGAVLAALSRIEAPAVVVTASQEKEVFIFCTETERLAAAPLIRFLKSKNIGARLPLFNGDEARRREANREMLVSADAVILFYGENDELWKHDRDREIGSARSSMADVFTYLAGPITDDKSVLLVVGGTDIIDGTSGFNDGSFRALLEALERT